MKLLIYAVLKNEETGETEAATFTRWQDLFSTTFSPIITDIFVTDFSISGKTYAERKANAEQLVIDYSNNIASGLSWGELAEVGARFETIGKRYGLLKEFRENGII